MYSLKLEKVACTQEMLFLILTATLILLLDSTKQCCYIQNPNYIVTDLGFASLQPCIMIIRIGMSKKL